jgi:hypothetical protein
MFSGQHSLHLLLDDWSNKSPLFLTIMAFLKLIFLFWCLQFNWRGGDIFPITFAGLTQGFAIAALIPEIDPLFIVAIVSTTILGEMTQPLVGGIFILLFFPITLSPVILITMILLILKK